MCVVIKVDRLKILAIIKLCLKSNFNFHKPKIERQQQSKIFQNCYAMCIFRSLHEIVKYITEMSIQIKPTHNDTWDMHFGNTNKFFAAPKPPGKTTACATVDDS